MGINLLSDPYIEGLVELQSEVLLKRTCIYNIENVLKRLG